MCLVVQRDPIQTAKDVATLDRVSNGRFLFGIGAGWNAEEMENHGTEYRTRLSLMRERVAGDEGDLDPVEGGVPRQVRELRPDHDLAQAGAEAAPAGAGRRRLAGRREARAIEYGDGWMPIHIPQATC